MTNKRPYMSMVTLMVSLTVNKDDIGDDDDDDDDDDEGSSMVD